LDIPHAPSRGLRKREKRRSVVRRWKNQKTYGKRESGWTGAYNSIRREQTAKGDVR
jgi:hypothetical protein